MAICASMFLATGAENRAGPLLPVRVKELRCSCLTVNRPPLPSSSRLTTKVRAVSGSQSWPWARKNRPSENARTGPGRRRSQDRDRRQKPLASGSRLAALHTRPRANKGRHKTWQARKDQSPTGSAPVFSASQSSKGSRVAPQARHPPRCERGPASVAAPPRGRHPAQACRTSRGHLPALADARWRGRCA